MISESLKDTLRRPHAPQAPLLGVRPYFYRNVGATALQFHFYILIATANKVHNSPVYHMHNLPLIELNSTSIFLMLKRIRSQAQDF